MTWFREKSPFIILSAVLALCLILFLLIPIVGTLVSSAPGLLTALTISETWKAILTSFYCAFLATLFILIIGVPFAYLFVRTEFNGKKLFDSLIDLPILIPHDAAGIALLIVFAPTSPIGAFFSSIGVKFIDTYFGIVIAMAFVSAPFMIRGAQEAFMSINPDVEKMGRSLGATRSQVFFHLTLPLALRGILTGCVLSWARSVSEFGAVILIAYFPTTAPVYLYEAFLIGGLDAALPITAVLILLSIVVLVVFRILFTKPTKLI